MQYAAHILPFRNKQKGFRTPQFLQIATMLDQFTCLSIATAQPFNWRKSNVKVCRHQFSLPNLGAQLAQDPSSFSPPNAFASPFEFSTSGAHGIIDFYHIASLRAATT